MHTRARECGAGDPSTDGWTELRTAELRSAADSPSTAPDPPAPPDPSSDAQGGVSIGLIRDVLTDSIESELEQRSVQAPTSGGGGSADDRAIVRAAQQQASDHKGRIWIHRGRVLFADWSWGPNDRPRSCGYACVDPPLKRLVRVPDLRDSYPPVLAGWVAQSVMKPRVRFRVEVNKAPDVTIWATLALHLVVRCPGWESGYGQTQVWAKLRTTFTRTRPWLERVLDTAIFDVFTKGELTADIDARIARALGRAQSSASNATGLDPVRWVRVATLEQGAPWCHSLGVQRGADPHGDLIEWDLNPQGGGFYVPAS
jgi:hypothetical protein